jgi:hypothetical protein
MEELIVVSNTQTLRKPQDHKCLTQCSPNRLTFHNKNGISVEPEKSHIKHLQARFKDIKWQKPQVLTKVVCHDVTTIHAQSTSLDWANKYKSRAARYGCDSGKEARLS